MPGGRRAVSALLRRMCALPGRAQGTAMRATRVARCARNVGAPAASCRWGRPRGVAVELVRPDIDAAIANARAPRANAAAGRANVGAISQDIWSPRCAPRTRRRNALSPSRAVDGCALARRRRMVILPGAGIAGALRFDGAACACRRAARARRGGRARSSPLEKHPRRRDTPRCRRHHAHRARVVARMSMPTYSRRATRVRPDARRIDRIGRIDRTCCANGRASSKFAAHRRSPPRRRRDRRVRARASGRCAARRASRRAKRSGVARRSRNRLPAQASPLQRAGIPPPCCGTHGFCCQKECPPGDGAPKRSPLHERLRLSGRLGRFR